MDTTPKTSGDTQILRAMDTILDEPLDVRATPFAGALLNDRYEIQGELGQGGIGIVYLARDRRVKDRLVVIKTLLETSNRSTQAAWIRRHFEGEITALALIDHPGVVSVTDRGALPDGNPFFVMQYVKGVSLRTILNNTKRLSLAQCGSLVRQISQALQAAHDKEVIHRDLKPENVMIHTDDHQDERVVLIDFGIASVGKGKLYDSHNTDKTAVAGSLPYMAPEQLEGKPVYASDTWALSVIAYECLTGQRPFTAHMPVELFQQQQTGNVTPPQQLRTDLPDDAAQLLLTALSFNPLLRPIRIRDFGEALDAALHTSSANDRSTASTTVLSLAGDENKSVPTPPTPEPSPRNLKNWLLGAVSLLVILLASYWHYWNIPKKKIITPPQPVIAEKVLGYSLSVLNADNKKGQPTELAGEMLFTGKLFLRLNVVSKKNGYLYLVDEGPELLRGLPHYIFLYPAPDLAETHLTAGRIIYLPDESITKGFKVDSTGTDKLWLIWSAEPLPVLEELRAWYEKNQQFPGEIADSKDVQRFQEFLQKNLDAAHPVAEKGERQTQLKLAPSARLLVHLIKISHA